MVQNTVLIWNSNLSKICHAFFKTMFLKRVNLRDIFLFVICLKYVVLCCVFSFFLYNQDVYKFTEKNRYINNCKDMCEKMYMEQMKQNNALLHYFSLKALWFQCPGKIILFDEKLELSTVELFLPPSHHPGNFQYDKPEEQCFHVYRYNVCTVLFNIQISDSFHIVLEVHDFIQRDIEAVFFGLDKLAWWSRLIWLHFYPKMCHPSTYSLSTQRNRNKWLYAL